MSDNVTHISQFVKHQFPAFYRDQGPNFIAFLEAYFEWLEDEGNIIYQTRNLYNTRDIDTTADQYLEFFKNKFMNDLPKEIIGNQRLFQKHILELYRAKGSMAGLKLLFRLLYNEDVSVYVPSYDIFKASDGIWKQPHYLEVAYKSNFWDFDGKVINGLSSGARAVVENVEHKVINGVPVWLINISNIFGAFQAGEIITYDGLELADGLRVLGSPRTLTVVTTEPGFTVGEILKDSVVGKIKPLRAVVSRVYQAPGFIEFELVSGGSYYTNNAVISITAGSNTSGSGADFEIGSFSNTSNYVVTSDMLAPYANVALNATTYGFPTDNTANSADVIGDCLDTETLTVGTIASIITTSPGEDYDGDVTVSITDSVMVARKISTPGGVGGSDAVVTGTAAFGNNLVQSLNVYDSGHGYNTEGETVTLVSTSNSSLETTANISLGGVGFSEGYYDDTRSFASNDKYLFDGHYYQDFSYVIRSSRRLDDFVEILKKTVHSVGNAVFGEPQLDVDVGRSIAITSATLTQTAI